MHSQHGSVMKREKNDERQCQRTKNGRVGGDPQNERTEGSGRERRDKGEGENLAVVVRRRRT